MTVWAAVAAAYGIVLAVAALAKPIERRAVAAAACAAYATLAIGSGTLPRSLWVELFTPAVLLLAGYWLSGFFFRDPQPWLEAFLLRSDSQLMDRAGLKGWLQRSPRWVLEALEASYAADYAVVGIGAIVAAQHGVDAVTGYWSLVLSAELACYAALPWLRSRPPRALETTSVFDARAVTMRRLNVAILDRASVQANTIPSGHVAGALAAALAVLPLNAAIGGVLLAASVAIGVAAVAGRYHYVVDCVAGASVALIVASLV
jgi:hypothetical protein